MVAFNIRARRSRASQDGNSHLASPPSSRRQRVRRVVFYMIIFYVLSRNLPQWIRREFFDGSRDNDLDLKFPFDNKNESSKHKSHFRDIYAPYAPSDQEARTYTRVGQYHLDDDVREYGNIELTEIYIELSSRLLSEYYKEMLIDNFLYNFFTDYLYNEILKVYDFFFKTDTYGLHRKEEESYEPCDIPWDDIIEYAENVPNKDKAIELIQESLSDARESIGHSMIKASARGLAILGLNFYHRSSLLTMANLCLLGTEYVKRDLKAAYRFYLELANNLGSRYGQRMVGLMKAVGIGTEQSYPLAHFYLNLSALSGDPISAQALGYWYFKGIGVKQDTAKALFYYETVAKFVINLYNQDSYYNGRIPENPEYLYSEMKDLYGPHQHNPKAYSRDASTLVEKIISNSKNTWQTYNLRAHNGDHLANLVIGLMYYKLSSENSDNFVHALKYFRKAAEAHNQLEGEPQQNSADMDIAKYVSKNAIGMIGFMYLKGYGVENDNMIARAWFEKGASLGDSQSLNNLALMYREGTAGLKKDDYLAVSLFAKAVNLGSVDAMFNIGLYYLEVLDYSNAYSYFHNAYLKGNLVSGYYLAKMRMDGLGVTRDIASAVRFYKWVVESSNWHDPILRKTLVTSDNETKFLLYLLGSEMGYEVAQVNAAMLIDRGDVNIYSIDHFGHFEDKYEMAFRLFHKASTQANPYALNKIAEYFYYGLGTSRLKFDPINVEFIAVQNEGQRFSDINDMPEEISGRLWVKLLLKLRNYSKSQHDKLPCMFNRRKGLVKYYKNPDPIAAFTIYKESLNITNSPTSAWNLGWMYENGIGVEKNYKSALDMYNESTKLLGRTYFANTISISYIKFKMFIESTTESFKRIIGKKKVDYPVVPASIYHHRKLGNYNGYINNKQTINSETPPDNSKDLVEGYKKDLDTQKSGTFNEGPGDSVGAREVLRLLYELALSRSFSCFMSLLCVASVEILINVTYNCLNRSSNIRDGVRGSSAPDNNLQIQEGTPHDNNILQDNIQLTEPHQEGQEQNQNTREADIPSMEISE